jgi:glycoside/pentoside/hexuronide:cation symporter, GPH family
VQPDEILPGPGRTESPGGVGGAAMRAATLSFGTILLYNLAGFAFNLYDTVLYAWLPYFYTPPADSGNTAYVTLFVFGVILFGGRILDAVTDPLLGFWSDRTRSRWGRRKPYIFISSPILFVTFVLVWRPPVPGVSTANAVWLGSVLFFYYWAYTGLLIPWLANLPELSPDNGVRMKIISVGIVTGIVGALVGGGLSGPLMHGKGPLFMALFLGVFAFAAGELTLFGIRENPGILPNEGPGFAATLKAMFSDRQVFSFSAMIMAVQMTYQLTLMNVPYVTTLILKKSEGSASLLIGEIIVLMAVSTPLWYFLLKTYPKRRIMRIIILLMALGFSASFMIGKFSFLSPFAQAILILPLAAVPMGGMFMASLGLIADLTDYGEILHGTRTEAVYFGIYGIARKTGWAFCSLILTATFSIFGYTAGNPLGVRVLWILCALFCLIGLILFIPYRLGDSPEETRRIMKA